MSKDITTIQLEKIVLTDLNKKKLQYEAKTGKRITVSDYIKELIKSC